MMNQPPRDRIKRPEMPEAPRYEPEPMPLEDNSEGLSQDDLNEWLTQKVIRLELEQFRKESREGRTPLQQQQPARRIEPERVQVKPKQQPYESMYGKTEDEVTPVKPKGKSKTKTILMFVAIIAIAYLLVQVGLYLFAGYSLPGG